MTLSIITLIIITECYNAEGHFCLVSLMMCITYAVSLMLSVNYAECQLCLVSIMLSVTYAECHI
jgi:hypothetical protein